MGEVEVKRVESSSRGAVATTASWGTRFMVGFRTPFDGWRFMLRHWTLWRYAFIPIFINTVLTLALLVGYGYGAYRLIVAMWSSPSFAGFWMTALAITLVCLIIVVVLGAAVVTYMLLGSMLSGYFNSILAKKVELVLGMPESELRDVPFRYQVVDAVKDATIILITNVFCLAIGFLPFVGPAISLYVSWRVFGYDYLDLPMELRGMRSKDKRAFAKKHRPYVVGLGAVVFLFNFVPFVGSIILTTAATGAVLLHRRLLNEAYGGGDVLIKDRTAS